MACQFLHNSITTASTPTEYKRRIGELERQMEQLDQSVNSLRSIVMDLAMRKSCEDAARLKRDGEPPSEAQEAAVKSLLPEYAVSALKFVNSVCCCGEATIGNAKYGLKITRKLLTLSKYQKPPVLELKMVDKTILDLLFPDGY